MRLVLNLILWLREDGGMTRWKSNGFLFGIDIFVSAKFEIIVFYLGKVCVGGGN